MPFHMILPSAPRLIPIFIQVRVANPLTQQREQIYIRASSLSKITNHYIFLQT